MRSIDIDWGTGWRANASCFGSRWHPDLWSSPNRASLGYAIWICKHECPVKAECLQWAQDNPDAVNHTVFGGVLWAANGVPAPVQPRPHQPRPIPIGPIEQGFVTLTEKHLDEVKELVNDGVSFTDIAEVTGASVVGVRTFVARHRGKPGWERTT